MIKGGHFQNINEGSERQEHGGAILKSGTGAESVPTSTLGKQEGSKLFLFSASANSFNKDLLLKGNPDIKLDLKNTEGEVYRVAYSKKNNINMKSDKSKKEMNQKFVKNQEYLKTSLFEYIQVKNQFKGYLPKNIFYEKDFENVMEIEIESDNGGDDNERQNKSYENPKGKEFSDKMSPVRDDGEKHDTVEMNEELFSFDEDDFLKDKKERKIFCLLLS